MYIDSVSDGHTGATVVPVGRGYLAGTDLSGIPATGFYPQSLTDEIQGQFTKEVTGKLQTIRKNPNFDPAMKAKVDRAGARQFVRLPLSDVCGIFDMERVVKGSKLQVELNKADPRQAIFGDDATSLLKISKVQLWIAKVRPSLKAQENFSSQLAKQSTLKTNFIGRHLITATSVAKGAGEHQLSVSHKVNKPTSVIVAFGYSDRFTNRALNPLQWDLQDRLSRVELRANNKQVPNVAYNPQGGDFTQVIHDLYKLGGKDELESPVLTWKNWQSNYPIFGFDLSQAEGDSHESRSIMTLDLNWAFSAGSDVDPYTIYVLINSESEAHLDYANGLTTLRIN